MKNNSRSGRNPLSLLLLFRVRILKEYIPFVEFLPNLGYDKYDTDRGESMETVNVGIVAHVDAGKTTLTEQMLFCAGVSRSAGSVDEGTAQTDYLEVERARGISVQASVVSVETGGKRINFIDTPGHVDFAAEVERSLLILDSALLLVSAVEGIQAQTEILWEALAQTRTNTVLFLNKIDRGGSDSEGVLATVQQKFHRSLLCFTEVLREGNRDCAVQMRSLADPSFAEQAAEALAEADEEIMERYLNGEAIGAAELKARLKKQIAAGKILPVLCGSGALGVGVRELLSFLGEYLTPVRSREDDALSGVVYKITHDKAMGRIAHVRMFGGEIRNRDSVLLSSQEEPQKVTQIRRYQGARFTDVGAVRRGEVAALCGLSRAKVADVIGEWEASAPYRLSVPLFQVQVLPKTEEDLYPLITAFEELSAEDPQLDSVFDPDSRELEIHITGMIQLEILQALVQERYGKKVSFSRPSVIYKETPTHPGRGRDVYTMPKPCWAIVQLDIKPLPRGGGFCFHSTVPNDKLFYRYQNHVEIALKRALAQGLFNWEVVDLDVTLSDGAHHTVHTHPMDFFLCTPIAFLKAMQDCGSTLLEPMQKLRIVVPEEYAGRVIGDLIAMRGESDSPVIRGGTFTTEALVPVASSMDYAVKLASDTAGRGVLSRQFAGYRECPLELGAAARRRGVNPLDRDRWILAMRGALSG